MDQADIELVVDARADIGESPAWSPAGNAIYWVDIKGRTLRRTDHATGKTRSWSLPGEVGGYALIPGDAAAVVALRCGIFRLDLVSGALDLLADPPFDPRTHRFNESGIDPAGRLWLGEMTDPVTQADAPLPDGPLHSFTLRDGLRTHPITAKVANGFAWSADGATFMLAHSEAGCIERIAFDVERGTFGRRSVFAQVDPSVGQPDGAAFDAEGLYWCAIHQGGRLHRYAPDGSIDRVVRFPVRNPTKITFAGPDLDVMYVTSASHGERSGDPHEGGLFRFRPGVAGRAITPFGG